jgi:hypothetical protein
MDRFDDDGNAQGFYDVGNATKFAIAEDAEIKERESRMKDTYGQVLDSVPIKKPASISITLNDLKVENLAMVLFGDITDINITGAAVTDEALTARLDKWVELDFRNVTAATVVVTDSAGVTTYVEDTDYEVNYSLGMIKALSTGAITDEEALLVDYTYGNLTGKKISGSARPIIKCSLKLDGENQVTQKDCLVNVLEAMLKPSGEIDFLADDFNEVTFEGTLNTPSGKTSPYEVEYMD